jgi:hypothetical protein
MESRKCPGLYFAGEVMDIDGPTGGYNLTAAFATAALAVASICKGQPNDKPHPVADTRQTNAPRHRYRFEAHKRNML